MKKNKKIIFSTVVPIFLFVSIIYILSRSIPQERFQQILDDSGIYAPLVYILLILISYIIAPLSGTPIMFVGYYAYGRNVIFLTTVAAYLSFYINFWIARKWGRPIIQRLVGKDNMTKVDSLTSDYGLVYLFLLRVFQGSVHDFLSFAVGLTSMKFSHYIIVSTLAIIPGTALWYYLSGFVSTPAGFTLLTFGILGVFSVLFLVGSKIHYKRRKDNSRVV